MDYNNKNKLITRADDKIAIIIHSLLGVQSISYRDLQEQLSTRKTKFIKNEIIGFCDKLSLDLILDYLAAIEAGAIPCFVAHPSSKISQLIWEHRLDNLIKLGITKILSKEFTLNSSNNLEINKTNIADNKLDICFIQTSSGTTNNQKAFCISQNKLKNQILSYSNEIDFWDQSIVASWLPLYHDMGLITSLFMPLYHGATTIIIPTFDWVLKNDLLFECIDHYQATHCWMPNFAFSLMTKKDLHLQNRNCKFYNCSEICRKSSTEQFYKKYPNPIFCTYAMAENVFAVTTSAEIDFAQASEILSSGRAIDGTKIKIENNKVFISGDALFDALLIDGKFNKSDEDWYDTGDMGELINNDLFIRGRGPDIVKVYGKQINLLDVDSYINERGYCHPGRCVSFVDDNKIIILYEGDKDNNYLISHSISSIFDVSVVVEQIPSGKLIKTSSGKFSRNLNFDFYKNRIFIRSFINNELINKNLPFNVGLRSSGAFDSFSIVEIWCKINMQLKKQIDWNLSFQELDTIEDFVNAI